MHLLCLNSWEFPYLKSTNRKPSTLAFELIQDRLGKLDPSEFVMFGDRLDTDIVFGKNCGIDTVLTLTGVTTQPILEKADIKPTHVIKNFTDLLT